MEKFKAGKRYKVVGGGVIEVTKRTPCFITFDVVENVDIVETTSGKIRTRHIFPGRKAIDRRNMFGLGETVLLNTDVKSFDVFCFASDEI